MPSSSPEPDDLLDALEKHGQQFMSAFNLPKPSVKRKRVQDPNPASESEYEDWIGFSDAVDDSPEKSNGPAIVLDMSSRPATSAASDALARKAFMSSKVSRQREELNGREKLVSRKEKEDDESNIQNDKLLHKMIHTKLLSGSRNPSLDMTPAQRNKALAGRVLELAGKTKLGKGEKEVRRNERDHASKKVRDGLVLKKRERDAKSLEEAKNLGNYHPSLKKLLADDEDKAPTKKRKRGLAMGIGSFKGGMLRLSRDDAAQATGKRPSNSKRR